MFLALVMFLPVAACGQSEGKTDCYENIGCFTAVYPNTSAKHLVSYSPQSPQIVNTQFLLFTRNNTDKYEVISAKNISTIHQSNANCSKKWEFIVHGWRDSGNATWVVNICLATLKKEDVNCVGVDWYGGAKANYFQAVTNAQMAGAEIAFFMKTIVEKCNASMSGMHIVGHSLGAHAAGEAGRRQPGVDRITCLDAAGPGFEGQLIGVPVNSSDAKFIDAIHTDTGLIGFGLTTLIGQKNFFPNGGKRMPGCLDSNITHYLNLEGFTDVLYGDVVCSHRFSYSLYTESILNPDGFMAYCAPDYESFQKGAGFPCSNDSCSKMGYYAEPDASPCRTYFLNIGPKLDHERWRYNVAVQIGGSTHTIGSIRIAMYNSSKSSDEYKIHRGVLVGGSTYSAFIDIRVPLPISRVTLTFHIYIPFLHINIWAESVTLTFGNTGAVYKFCGNETKEGNNTQTLEPCP